MGRGRGGLPARLLACSRKYVQEQIATHGSNLDAGADDPASAGGVCAAGAAAASGRRCAPRSYVYCTEGKGEGSDQQALRATYRSAPGWRYREIAANHLAPITAPKALAEAFLLL